MTHNNFSILSRMRCAVVGAGGFIGTNLCKALDGRVSSLRAFGRRKSFPDAFQSCEWISGDFSDSDALKSAISNCDVVFHLVNGTTPASANVDKEFDFKTNVIPTINFLEICRKNGVRRVIFVSSGGTIYGIPALLPTPETAPTNPITAYGISKLIIEKYLNLYKYIHGLDYRVLRLSNPYGPYQTSKKKQGVISAFINKAIQGKPIEIWGDGSVIRDYVYIDDVVEALIRSMVHEGDARIFNIGSGLGLSLSDIVNALKRHFGADISVERKPSRRVDIPVSILDTTRAATDLDWIPQTKFDDGLRSTIEWINYVQNK